MRDAQGAVTSVLGSKGDEAILEYVVGCLEDEHFEWGEDAEEGYEVFGEMLVMPRAASCRTDCRRQYAAAARPPAACSLPAAQPG